MYNGSPTRYTGIKVNDSYSKGEPKMSKRKRDYLHEAHVGESIRRIGSIPLSVFSEMDAKMSDSRHKAIISIIKMHEDDPTVQVHRVWWGSDGWLDGFNVIWAIIEKDDKLMKIKWHEGNGEWFVKSETGGAYPLRLS